MWYVLVKAPCSRFIKSVLESDLEAEVIVLKLNKNVLDFSYPEVIQWIPFEQILCEVNVTHRKNGTISVQKKDIQRAQEKFEKYDQLLKKLASNEEIAED